MARNRNRSVRYVEFGMSSARQYWVDVGLPAYECFLASPTPAAAITASWPAWHVHEWLWHERHPGVDHHGHPDYLTFRDCLIDQCEELDWVRDIADASKHRGLGRQGEVAGVRRQIVIKRLAGRSFGGRAAMASVPGGLAIELTDGSEHLVSAVLATGRDLLERSVGADPGQPGIALTPADAQAIQDDARARDRWLIWFVATDPAHPGKLVAWAMAADPQRGTRFPGELVADTLDELRAMLPAGLKRSERTPMLPPEVIETWD
jgi:hypothetical protein